jgi:hypothetical protein
VSLLALAATFSGPACTSDSGTGPVTVSVPSVSPAVQRVCERLAADLPASIGDDLARRTTQPASPLVAAWGNPAVVLRCGVPVDPDFSAGDQVIEITRDGTVGWWANRKGDTAIWSTPRATVHVEVRIPSKYQGADILTPLTPAVSRVRLL